MSKSMFHDIHEGRQPHPPVALLLGWKTIEFDDQKGFIRGEMQAKEAFLNPAGVIQGGMICAMLDNAAGLAVLCTLEAGQTAPSLELKTSFMRPATVGKYIGEAWIKSQGAGICFVEAQLLTTTGRLVATASATARLLIPRHV